jgi:hypothetical protein
MAIVVNFVQNMTIDVVNSRKQINLLETEQILLQRHGKLLILLNFGNLAMFVTDLCYIRNSLIVSHVC